MAPRAKKLTTGSQLEKVLAFKEFCRKVTATATMPKGAEASAPSDIKAIVRAIREMKNICSGGKEDVANLLTAVTGKDIKTAYKIAVGVGPVGALVEEFGYGCVVVPLTNRTGHNYTIGKPAILIRDGDVCLKADGHFGNHIDKNSDLKNPSVRVATAAEFEQFFKIIEAIASEEMLYESAIVYMDSVMRGK